MEKIGISVAHSELEDKPGLAKLADQAGFDYIWNSAESIAAFGGMVSLTNKAKIGSGIIRAFEHPARNLATHAYDLQRISHGRWILGLGGGTKYMNIRLLGQPFEHAATRMRELIGILRAVWTTPPGKIVEFKGEYYEYNFPGVAVKDVPPPPIFIAGLNPATIRLTGELCDGICGHPVASVPFIQNIVWPNLDAGLKKAGKTRKDFEHHGWIITSISNDRKQALRELKHEVGRFMSTRSFAIVPDSQGLESVRLAIQDAFFNHPGNPDKLIDAVPDDVAYLHGIAGTPDDVREQFKRYEGVIDVPAFYCPPLPGQKERTLENLKNMIEVFGKN